MSIKQANLSRLGWPDYNMTNLTEVTKVMTPSPDHTGLALLANELANKDSYVASQLSWQAIISQYETELKT